MLFQVRGLDRCYSFSCLPAPHQVVLDRMFSDKPGIKWDTECSEREGSGFEPALRCPLRTNPSEGHGNGHAAQGELLEAVLRGGPGSGHGGQEESLHTWEGFRSSTEPLSFRK